MIQLYDHSMSNTTEVGLGLDRFDYQNKWSHFSKI